MQHLDELDLLHLPVEDEAFHRDPFPWFRAARQQHPWLATCSFAHVITSYRALRELLGHEDSMCVGFGHGVEMLGAGGTPWGEFVKQSVQNQVGALHKRLRDAVAPAFTPRAANDQRSVMREEMTRLLAQWGPREAFEFGDFAANYPVSVMSRIIGADPRQMPQLRRSLETLGVGGSFDAAYLSRLQEAFGEVDDFVRGLVTERRRGLRVGDAPDLLDRLLAINGEGNLSDDELFNLLVFLFVAGYDTSKNVLSTTLYLLLDRPEHYRRCGEDREYARQVVSEVLRYQGPASSPRVLLEDIVLRDVQLPAGTMLFVPWSVLNRDPDAFGNPDRFDPERPRDAQAIAFGLGPHVCLGQYIARAQLEEGLHLMARHMREPRLTGEVRWREFVGVWGLRALPIAFNYHGANAA